MCQVISSHLLPSMEAINPLWSYCCNLTCYLHIVRSFPSILRAYPIKYSEAIMFTTCLCILKTTGHHLEHHQMYLWTQSWTWGQMFLQVSVRRWVYKMHLYLQIVCKKRIFHSLHGRRLYYCLLHLINANLWDTSSSGCSPSFWSSNLALIRDCVQHCPTFLQRLAKVSHSFLSTLWE